MAETSKMMTFAWNWLRKNVNLVLLLVTMICLALALGEVIRGATWSLLMPVSLTAVVVSWELGGSRLSPKQAWASLTVLGIPGVFIYVGGLIRPLGRLVLSIFALVPQIVARTSERVPIDTGSLSVAWAELTHHVSSLFIRLWEWTAALLAGRPFVDPLAAGFVWTLILWLIGVWAGWRLRRNLQALEALAPGGVVLALVLDYSHGEVDLLVMYLATLLTLMGLTWLERMHLNWEQRGVAYSESVRIDTLGMIGMMTIALVLSAAGAPSLSWRELVQKLQRADRVTDGRAAEALGLERPVNVANSEAYRSGGLPREHLLSAPPELLQEVVMTVSTGEFPPLPEVVTDIKPNRYYWRAITYDVYSGAGWGSSQAQEISLPSNTPLLEAPAGYRIVNQHIQRTPDQGRYVYWAGTLAQVDTDVEIAWRTKPPNEPAPAHFGDMLGALTNLDKFTVLSYVPQYSIDQLRAAGSNYPSEIARRYLRLPDSTPERVLALAREITQAAPTPYDRAAALESYLRTFPYTLEVDPPPPGRDVVDYFLFTAQQGYCDYYATSMVVLARAVGLPARIVIGYTSGDYDATTAEYIVRQENAHSWAEVYFPGLGWVEFEPTAGQPFIERVGDVGASESPPGLPSGQSTITRLKAQWRALISSLGGQFLIASLGFVFLFALWQLGEMGFLNLIPARRAIPRMYSRLQKASMSLLPDLPDGHTPYQLGTALTRRLKGEKNRLITKILSPADTEIENLVSLHVFQVFSEHPPTKSQVRGGVRNWIRLRWRLWIARGWDYLSGRMRH
jgi:transglutaminase-like putative cysteine protease